MTGHIGRVSVVYDDSRIRVILNGDTVKRYTHDGYGSESFKANMSAAFDYKDGIFKGFERAKEALREEAEFYGRPLEMAVCDLDTPSAGMREGREL